MRAALHISFGLLLSVGPLACSKRQETPRPAFESASAEGAPPRDLRPIPADLPLHYRIEVRLLPRHKRLRGKMTVAWRNVSDKPQTKLLAHQYLNAFSSADTLFMRESAGRFRQQQADPARRGSIRVSSVRVHGVRTAHRELHDGTVVEVDLPAPVPPGGQSELSLRFEAQLPRVFARTGYAGDFFMVAQWYPKLGFLRRDGRWHCPPFHPNSEFFGRFARFDVAITLPVAFRVGATGSLDQRSTGSAGDQTLSYSARGVHDFAFSAWPHFSEHQARSGQVTLRLLSPPNRAGKHQQLISLLRRSFELLQRWLGRYPYPQLTVVDVPSNARGAMGMEYPTLFTTWLPDWAPASINAFAELTVHELTHQYFQGIVATNEVDEPWLDEGVTSFISGLLLDELLGRERSFISLPGLSLGQWEKSVLHQLSSRPPTPIAQPARGFADWKNYASTVYGRAATLLYTIDDLIGRQRMLAAISRYVQENAFRHPTGEALRRQLLAHTPRGDRRMVETLLGSTLDRSDTLDYRLSCGDDRVGVQRRGPIALPLHLYWRDASGRVQTRRVRLGARAETFETPNAESAWLGPARRLGLDPTPRDNRCAFDQPAQVAVAPLAARLQQLLWLLAP